MAAATNIFVKNIISSSGSVRCKEPTNEEDLCGGHVAQGAILNQIGEEKYLVSMLIEI